MDTANRLSQELVTGPNVSSIVLFLMISSALGAAEMRDNKEKPVLFVLAGLLASGLLLVTLCAHLCPPAHDSGTLFRSVICLNLSHSVTYADYKLVAIFILPFTVLSGLLKRHFLPEGVKPPFFRPPRFSF